MHEQIQTVPAARDKVKIAFTEWLFGGESESAPRYDNMGGAITNAGFLNMLMRVADFVPVSDMTGTIYFGGIWKERSRVFGVPAYWAFRMYSNTDATRPVEITTNSPKYNVEQGSNRLPKIPDVPYLDVVAALNSSGDTMTMFCVNRHLSRDITTDISISGFKPAGQVAAESLYGSSIYEKNDEVTPDAIHPRSSTVNVNGSQLDFTFRHESVTVLKLHRAK